ncbi:response regulator receiver modulated diguanylate cyclase/phosphodiesterase [Thalassoporum mexicanum PCC 7367]|uniref:putative bifunctional diguanylate cyclase/phosphodiesterase n=1 Tax=Thalassoporum mexicanum TaxID=3457544 RepID=UPI00029FCE03|nr:EAL domain-containing response regulator [Pseudanabaena sp. PCC 7367]AFY70795.1 response regulator receiver modulated diguanylate cyclase/phosphodiesterase [Pseudanabaena sp. PCC 7367]
MKILVIEDMEALREEVIDTLSYEGFDVMGAENGLVGVKIAQSFLPDLIVCDVMMPELDGYATLEILRQNPETAAIPFIFLTAKADKGDMRQGMELGADDYLTKPFTVSELIGAVNARLRKYAALRTQYDKKLRQTEAKLEYVANRDELTKLPNRILFHEYLHQLLQPENEEAQQICFAIIFIDVDRFNDINTTLGQDVGDALLQALAERLRSHLGHLEYQSMIARLRGDEFAIAMQDITGIEDIRQKLHNLLEVVYQPYAVCGHELSISVSVGITIYPEDSKDVDTLLKNADLAMYHAKKDGIANTFKFYSLELYQRSSERVMLSNGLRRAIERNEFCLFYQPKLNLKTGRIVGAEALIRWQHPELGLVMPSKFIPLAEETGLIVYLSEWVIKQACSQIRQWQQQDLMPIRVSVNLSGRDFKRDRLVENVEQAIAAHEIAPNCLELEITEGIIVSHTSLTKEILAKLRALGIRITVDDFGTGYSSLSYLRNFPIDTLKIDRCFVQNIDKNDSDAAITMAVIDLARALSLEVVAEGVENQAQLEFMKRANCDCIQGFYFSRPVPATEFAGMLAAGKILEV